MSVVDHIFWWAGAIVILTAGVAIIALLCLVTFYLTIERMWKYLGPDGRRFTAAIYRRWNRMHRDNRREQ